MRKRTRHAEFGCVRLGGAGPARPGCLAGCDARARKPADARERTFAGEWREVRCAGGDSNHPGCMRRCRYRRLVVSHCQGASHGHRRGARGRSCVAITCPPDSSAGASKAAGVMATERRGSGVRRRRGSRSDGRRADGGRSDRRRADRRSHRPSVCPPDLLQARKARVRLSVRSSVRSSVRPTQCLPADCRACVGERTRSSVQSTLRASQRPGDQRSSTRRLFPPTLSDGREAT